MTERLPSVLIVDDDEDHRGLMARRLSDEGIGVVEAASGEQALERLAGVDLVLLDYRLPRATGLDVLQALRAHPSPPSVVMVTGMGSERVAVDVLRAGAIDYVIKDSGYLDALPSVVERAWRHHELARRARRLEDLALVVASATDRHALFREVLEGARELLGADAAGLYVEEEARGLRLVATSVGETVTDVLGTREIREDVQGARLAGGVLARPARMVVSFPAENPDAAGAIVVVGEADRVFTPPEVRLAETFAAFAGTALQNLNRLQLERALVDELQRTLDQRRDFVASISHELRTPVTCIAGFADTLVGRWDRLTDAERREFVERMRRHGLELWDLINQLLDMAAEEGGRLDVDLEEIDLAEAAASTIRELSPVIGERVIHVELPDLTVFADRRLLSRTLSNLLSNAVKYSPPDRPVTIRAQVDPDQDEVRVDVLDQGQGIDPDELTHVFEPFWRGASARALAVRGAGIGLSLVREYVRLMHGRTFVASDPGQGTTLSFTLPRASADSSHSAESAGHRAPRSANFAP